MPCVLLFRLAPAPRGCGHGRKPEALSTYCSWMKRRRCRSPMSWRFPRLRRASCYCKQYTSATGRSACTADEVRILDIGLTDRVQASASLGAVRFD